MATTGAAAHEPQGVQQTRNATASGWIGSALEYDDFFIYATAASLVFPQIFSPKGAIGSLAFAITITMVAAIAAWSARETFRVPMNDLGERDAQPLDAAEYERPRAQAAAA